MAEIWTRQTRQRQPQGAVAVSPKYKAPLFVLLPSANPNRLLGGLNNTVVDWPPLLSGGQVGLGVASTSSNEISVSPPGFSSIIEATIVAVQISGATGIGWHNQLNFDSGVAHWPYTDGKIYLNALSTTRWVSNLTPPVSAGNLENIVITAKTGDHRFYINGSLIASSTTQNFGMGRSNARIGYGAGRDALGWGYVGSTFLLSVIPQLLPDAEARSLSANPWQLFAPERRVSYFFPASGIPALSAATAVSIGSTTATPRVTVTF